MAYKIIEGDLIEMFDKCKFDIIIHGCNCFHTMKAGIAKQISKKYPQVLYTDMLKTKHGDIEKLSNWSAVDTQKGTVINLYTQFKPGPNFDVNAFLLGIKKLKHRFIKRPELRIGIPKIGCGIGGYSWDKLEKYIIEILGDLNITVVEYKPKK